MSIRHSAIRGLALIAALALAISVLAATAPSGGATAPSKGSSGPIEVNVTKDLKHRYGEPEVAVNPKNPKNMVYAVLTMGTTYACQKAKGPGCTEADSVYGAQPAGLLKNVPGFSQVRVYVTFDGGTTWKRVKPPLTSPDAPKLVETGDPLLTVGPDGTFSLGWDAIRFCDCETTIIDAGGIGTSKSTDGGRTWSTPVLSGTPVDRPFFAADASTGRIYEASSGIARSALAEGDPELPEVPIGGPGNDRLVVASDDGVHWTDPKPFGGVPTFPPGTFVSAAHGMFASAFSPTDPALCGGTPGCTIFQTTTDDGATWSRHVLPPDVSGAPLVAADPSTDGHFAVAVQNGAKTQYLVYVTTDAGATWSVPTTVTDDASKTHFHAWMAYSPKGVLGLMWQTNVDSAPAAATGAFPAALPESVLASLPEEAREAIEAGRPLSRSVLETLPEHVQEALVAQAAGPLSPYNVWAAISEDGGTTFSAPLKVSKADSPAPQEFLPFGVGDDFSFIAMSAKQALIAWADYRPGDRQGFFRAVPFGAFKQSSEG